MTVTRPLTAVEMDIWQVADEESAADGDDDKPPAAVKAIMSPMRANLEGVTIDYGLYAGRFWLPRTQAAEGSAQVAFMRVPFHIYWRQDASLLAQLPIEGKPLFDAALLRCVRAAA